MHEIIFYNGFNLLVDLIVGFAVWFFTYRSAWWSGYVNGIKETKEGKHD